MVTVGSAILVAVIVGGYSTLRWYVRSSADNTLRQAEQYLRQRENARACETLQWLLWFDPHHHRALLINGVCLNADRKFPDAIRALERIPDSSDQFRDSGIALASSLDHDKQFDRAADVLRRYLRRFPRSDKACEELVHLYLKLLRQREAISLLEEFWDRNPNEDFGALLLLLELEVRTETPYESVGILEEADRLHPRQPAVVLALSRAYSLMGKTEQAQAQFEFALQLNPHDLTTRVLAAEFFFNRGDAQSARRLLKLGLVEPVEDDRYWFLLCRIAEHLGDAEEAYFFLQKSLSRRPSDETYVLMLATLLRRMGRLEDARSAAQKGAQLAEDRKQLYLLSHQFDRTHPSSDLCLKIADRLERSGNIEQSRAWRHVSRLLTLAQPAISTP